MLRRITMGVLAGVLLTSAIGCRNSCGERRGLCNWGRDDCSNGILTGHRGGKLFGGSECVGEPIPGQLMSFPASAGVPMLPPPGAAPLPNELPMPAPSDLIPRQPVPFAPPSPAPAPIGDSSTTSSPTIRK